MNWLRTLKGKAKKDELLSKHTTFRIGGAARYFVEPEDELELKFLVKKAKLQRLPILVLGAGSNLLVKDGGINALVVKLSSVNFKGLYFNDRAVTIGAGCLLGKAIKVLEGRGLSAFEFLIGVPGTLGGALVMNAGIHGKNIGDLVEDVKVMDYNGNTKTLHKNEIKFGYRKSSLSKYIVLNSRLRFTRKKKRMIGNAIENYLKERKNKQELSLPSAGCVFKNPFACSAGMLIDLCGLKGKRIGGAYVSAKHANFIMNAGKAKAEDVFRLMELIIKKVKNKFNIVLEPEITIWK